MGTTRQKKAVPASACALRRLAGVEEKLNFVARFLGGAGGGFCPGRNRRTSSAREFLIAAIHEGAIPARSAMSTAHLTTGPRSKANAPAASRPSRE